MTQQQKTEDAIIFSILHYCLVHQVEALEGAYKGNAKRLVNNLLASARQSLREIQKEWTPEAKEGMDAMYDFFYAVVRHASEVRMDDTEEFLKMIRDFTESRK